MKKRHAYRGITFYRLLIAFFVITFVCTAIIMFQYIHFLDKQDTQMQESYLEMSNSVFGAFSAIIEQFEGFGSQLAEALPEREAIIDSLEFPSGSEEAYDLWEMLNHYYNSQLSGAANVAYLYLSNSQRTISLPNYEQDAYNGGEILTILGLRESTWNQLISAKERVVGILEKTEQMSYSRLMLAQEIYPDVVLIVGIAQANISRALQTCYLPSDSQILVLSENEVALSVQSSQEEIPLTFKKAFALGEKGETLLEGKKYYYYQQTLCDDQLSCITLIPDTYSQTRRTSILSSLILSMIIWVIFGGGFSYLLTRRLYRPIGTLMENLPEESGQEKEPHEFARIHTALQSLSHKNIAYERQLLRQNRMLARNLWIRTLKGELSLSKELMAALENGGFPVSCSSYCIVLARACSMPEGEESEEALVSMQADEAAKQDSLYAQLESFLEGTGRKHYFAEDGFGMVGLVETGEEPSQELYSMLLDMKALIQKKSQTQMGVFAGDVHKALADMAQAYQEAGQVADYAALVEDYDSVYLYGYNAKLLEHPDVLGSDDLEKIHRLSVCLQCRRYGDGIAILDELFVRLMDQASTGASHTDEVSYLIDTVRINLKNQGVDSERVDKNRLVLKSLKELQKYLTGLLRECQAQEERDSSANQKILNIAEYIKEHYADPNLSASSVAEEFHISIPWLSTTFKREMQEGFLDYMHKCRIAKVRELIVSTDLSLKEISEKVGYSNYLTMSRAFKRYVGVTPKWYRQNEGME